MQTISTSPDQQARNRYRWVVLVLCWLAFTMTSVDRSTWGPASVFVGEDLGVPLASLGVFATAYYIATSAPTPSPGCSPTGSVAARWSPSHSPAQACS